MAASDAKPRVDLVLGAAEFSLYTSLRFYYTKKSFVLVPKDPSAPEELVFDRTKVELGVLKQPRRTTDAALTGDDGGDEEQKVFDVHGIIGVLNLSGGPHLAVILDRSFACTIDDQEIFRIDEVGIFSIRPHVTMNSSVRRRNAAYIGLVKSLLEHRDFYFSYSMDISNTIARKTSSTYPAAAPHYYRFDQRFFWNKLLVKSLIKKGCDKFILGITRGCFQSQLVVKQGQTIEFFLFSRRSRHRAGTRYRTRGADKHGNVANYVETEQLVRVNGEWSSFVQTRGSIPLLWSQTGKRLSPAVKINSDDEENRQVLSSHFEEQLRFYNRQLCVSLLDLTGGEAKLATAYKAHVEAQRRPNLIFHAFDFHAETKGNKFDNAWSCIEGLASVLKEMGFHHVSQVGAIKSAQTLVVRTNCLDCLDRTNVMQSFFALYSLQQQLSRYALSTERNDLIDRAFKQVWANNGDYISRQYAGTSALKGDFTRTGKRDAKGVMKDGVNSLSRYYINNFRDQQRQAAIDLFLGKYNYSQASESNVVSRAFCSFNPKQMQAIEASQSWIIEHTEMGEAEAEPILGCWVVISFNKWGIEQERIFVVTTTAYYRFKCDINKDGHVLRATQVPLQEIESISCGAILDSPSRYGIALRIQASSDRSASQTYQVYASLDFTQDLIQDVLDTVVEAHANLTGKQLTVAEEGVEVKKGGGSKIINSLKIGRYNKGAPASPVYSPHPNRATANRVTELNDARHPTYDSTHPQYYMPLSSEAGDISTAAAAALSAANASQPIYQTGPTPLIPMSAEPPPSTPPTASALPELPNRTRPRSVLIAKPNRPPGSAPQSGRDLNFNSILEGDTESPQSQPQPQSQPHASPGPSHHSPLHLHNPFHRHHHHADEDAEEEEQVDQSMPTPPDSDDEWTFGTVKPRSTTASKAKAQNVFDQIVSALSEQRPTSPRGNLREAFLPPSADQTSLTSPRLINSNFSPSPSPRVTVGSQVPPPEMQPQNDSRWTKLSAELLLLQEDLESDFGRDTKAASVREGFLADKGRPVTVDALSRSPPASPIPSSPLSSPRPKLSSISRPKSPLLGEASFSPWTEVCASCGAALSAGEGVAALEKRYHAACFVCTNCKKEILHPGKYVKLGGNPYCVDCKSIITSCALCHKEVRGDAIRSSYGLFHTDCYTTLKRRLAERKK